MSAFNQLLVTWPASVVGRLRGHVRQEFFAAGEQKKQDVKMKADNSRVLWLSYDYDAGMLASMAQ